MTERVVACFFLAARILPSYRRSLLLLTPTCTYTPTIDLNEGNIEYTFFILAAVGAVNTVLFAFVARGFVYAHDAAEDSASVADEDVYGKVSRRGSTVSAR